MPVWVSKEAPRSTGTPEIELHIVFPGEANSSQSLHPRVASLPVTIADVRLCHAHCLGNFIRLMVQGVSSIVNSRACAGQIESTVYQRMSHCLETADHTPILFAGPGIRHGRIQYPLHPAHAFRAERETGTMQTLFQHLTGVIAGLHLLSQ